jgi:hypothetical protein
VWFQLERGTRLGLEQTAGAVRIAHYAIRVAPFDRQTVTRRFAQLGVRVLPAADEPEVIRFADDNGIIVELRAAAAAPQQARAGAPAARYARHRTFPRDQRRSRLPVGTRRLPAEGSLRVR